MTLQDRVRERARTALREVKVYKRVLAHPETPTSAKVLLAGAVAYAVSPVDLIPDWVPVLGQLDDIVIVTGLARTALGLIPPEIVDGCRAEVDAEESGRLLTGGDEDDAGDRAGS